MENVIKDENKSLNMTLSYGLTVRGIIKNDEGEILIVKRHPKSRTDPEMWELPGGKVEDGEFFADALVREIKEETDLECDVGNFAEAVQNDYPHKRTVQIMMYLENVREDVRISDEHTDWMWASLDEIKSFGTDLIEMETSTFYAIADLMDIPAIALLVISDNSATGVPLLGRGEELAQKYINTRSNIIPDMIFRIAGS